MKQSFSPSNYLILVFALTFAIISQVAAQNVVISDQSSAIPDASAMLDVQSSTKGILVPRMKTIARNSILTPAVGLLVFDTDTESFWYQNGSTWVELKVSPWSYKSGPVIYTSDAQVGIGLNDPESALHVKGTVIAQESSLPNTDDGEFYMQDANGDTRIHFNKVYSNNETFFRIEVYVPDPNGEARVQFFGNTDAKTKRVEFLRGNGFNSERSAAIGVDQENSFFQASGGNLGVGTPDPDPNAILDITSTTKGVLFPRMSTVQRTTLGNTSPQNSLLVFDTNTSSYWYWVGSNWVELKSGVSNGWNLTGNANTDPATNFVGTMDDKSLAFRVNDTERMTLDNQGRLFLIGSGNNTGVGNQALLNNVNGIHNVAVGAQAMYNNTDGQLNVAMGRRALFANTIGTYNTAVGYEAMRDNTIGEYNTALGNLTLIKNTSGEGNTATGQEALLSNLTGNYNTAHGNSALFLNETGNNNVAVGAYSLYYGKTGSQLVAVGDSALFNNTDGIKNTAIGSNALFSNISGYSNTANGYQTLYKNVDGGDNTAIGLQALFSNTSGNANTAVGQQALFQNLTGSNNVAVGRNALTNNKESFSTAVGNNALRFNTTGNENTAIGYNALQENGIGNFNTAIGTYAGQSNTDGANNCFFGRYAGNLNTTGKNNTFVGDAAGQLNTTGEENVCIGKNAEVTAGNLKNAIAIGHSTNVNASNKIRLGNTGILVIEGEKIMTTSDGRYKSNLLEDIPGLDLIKTLRPVSYNFDYIKFSRFLGEKNADVEHLLQKEQRREMGFVAQEVEAACHKAGLPTTNLLHAPANEQDNYSMSYGQLTVPLVKAVQEQQALIEGQKTEITDLKAQLAGMQMQIQTLLSEVKSMKASVGKKDEGK